MDTPLMLPNGEHNHGGETTEWWSFPLYERNSGETQAGDGDDGSANRSERTSSVPDHDHNISTQPAHTHAATAVIEPDHDHPVH